MDNHNLLKKYALNYLSKYDSSKKNLEKILKNKINKIKDLPTTDKNNLNLIIKKIIENLEKNKIINDENFANTKIRSYFSQGRSEFFIKQSLLKKGINIELVENLIDIFEIKNPNWKFDSAIKFAKKRQLGKFGNNKNKQKDLAKMARAGFDYNTAMKALDYD